MRRSVVALAGLVLVLSGCRTYGRYDAQEKMLPEMQQAVRTFAGDLEQARAQLDLLQQAASGDSALSVVADEYEHAVDRHAEILDENQQLVARFQDDLPGYRTVHRTFGAMLSEHRVAHNRYRSLTKAVRFPDITRRAETGGTPLTARQRSLPDTMRRARDESFTEGRYYVAPIFYDRLQSVNSNLTMRQALAERSTSQRNASQRNASQSTRPVSAAPDESGAPDEGTVPALD